MEHEITGGPLFQLLDKLRGHSNPDVMPCSITDGQQYDDPEPHAEPKLPEYDPYDRDSALLETIVDIANPELKIKTYFEVAVAAWMRAK